MMLDQGGGSSAASQTDDTDGYSECPQDAGDSVVAHKWLLRVYSPGYSRGEDFPQLRLTGRVLMSQSRSP